MKRKRKQSTLRLVEEEEAKIVSVRKGGPSCEEITDNNLPDSHVQDEVCPSPNSSLDELSKVKGTRKTSSSVPIKSKPVKRRGHDNQKATRSSSRSKNSNQDIWRGKSQVNKEEMMVDLDISVSSVEVSEDETIIIKQEKTTNDCDWCKKMFGEKDWGKLNRHKKLAHEISCSKCDLMFVDDLDLKKHSRESHGVGAKFKQYSYECRKCLKKSRSFDINIKHEQLEHQYKCQICIIKKVDYPFSFIDNVGLKRHKEKVHSGETFAELVNLSDRYSEEDVKFKGDKSQDSDDSILMIAVMPKLIKDNKHLPQEDTTEKRKANKSCSIKNAKLEEKMTPQECSVKCTSDADSKENEHKEFIDYSDFIINESLPEDRDFFKVTPVVQIQEQSGLASKSADYGSSELAKCVTIQNITIEQPTIGAAQNNHENIISEKEATCKENKTFDLKESTNVKIQDCEISTTSPTTPERKQSSQTEIKLDSSQNNETLRTVCQSTHIREVLQNVAPPFENDNPKINSESFKQLADSVEHNQEKTVVQKDGANSKKRTKTQLKILTNGKLELSTPSKSLKKKVNLPEKNSQKKVARTATNEVILGDKNKKEMFSEPVPQHSQTSTSPHTNLEAASGSLGSKYDLVKLPTELTSVSKTDSVLFETMFSRGSDKTGSFPHVSTKSSTNLGITADITNQPQSPRRKSPISDGLSLISTYMNTSSETDSPVAKSFPDVVLQDSHKELVPVSSTSPSVKNTTCFAFNSLNGVRPLEIKRNRNKFREIWHVKSSPSNSVHHERIEEPEKQDEMVSNLSERTFDTGNSTDDSNAIDIDQDEIYIHCSDSEDENEKIGTTQDLLGLSISSISPTHEMDYIYSVPDPTGLGLNYEADGGYDENQTYLTLETEPEKTKMLEQPKLLEQDFCEASIDELLDSDDEDEITPSDMQVSPSSEQHQEKVRKDSQSYSEHRVKIFNKFPEEIKEIKPRHAKKIKETVCCPDCKTAFKEAKKLENHIKILHDYACNSCKRAYVKESRLKEHMQFAHNIFSKGSFVCILCQHPFKYKWHYNDHLQISHDHQCQSCPLKFNKRSQMENHQTDAHPDESGCSELKCEECALSIPWEEFQSHIDLIHSFPCTHQVDPSCNAPHLQFVSSHDLACHVHREHGGPNPAEQVKPPGIQGPTSGISDGKDGASLTLPEESSFEETCSSFEMDDFFEKMDDRTSSTGLKRNPALKCNLCDNTFADTRKLMDHMKRRHPTGSPTMTDNFTRDREFGFVCSFCELEFMERKSHQRHLKDSHPFSCSHGDCHKKYTNQKNLSTHLRKDHGIVHINICGEDEDKMTLTATRSLANVKMVQSADEWIRSEGALEHMVKVMRRELSSRRHELFMDRKQRERCGGLDTSKLYILSNPGFMGEGGEEDSEIIRFLVNKVFKTHLHQSDPRLKQIGIESGFAYATTVLFPEVVVHQHQLRNGLSIEEAEKAFMEIKVTEEEREGFDEEIREAAAAQDSLTDSDDNWEDD